MRLAFLIVVALCASVAAQSAQSAHPLIERIETGLVPSLLIENEPREPVGIGARMAQLGVPGASLAFVEGGEVVWARAYGLAHVATGTAATPETRFQAASLSKPIAATAALDLVDDGRLALDADVNRALASWRVPDSPLTADAPVTLRGLLTHTAGLSVHGFSGYGPGETVPTTAGVLRGDGNSEAVRVAQTPRTAYRYSGGGYTVAQLMIEDVTGQPFADVLRTRVLAPLGMRHSTAAMRLPQAVRSLAATGYRPDGTPVDGRFHTYPEQAAAGLWTTPTDLARWLLAIQRSLAGEPHPVLDAQTVRQMVMPDPVGGHGLGPGVRPGGGFFGHSGANEGFHAVMTAETDGGRAIVVMTNSDLGGVLAHEVLITVADHLGWDEPGPTRKTVVALAAADLGRFAGRYCAVDRPGLVVTIRVAGADLVFAREWDGGAIRLAPESPTAFFDRRDATAVVFASSEGDAFTVDGLRFERIAAD
ncbi:serine hydrolase domain-containing protein [Rubrivirga sp. IMCC43871]|uniref:serine hydrolase domain-containing protein n=1 Tax=Rubrivirga sp. IMCC43871 TaxID=3391575 RepID=UPI00398FF3E4